MPKKTPTVLILGAGFGGLQATRQLADAPVNISLIDRRNYHLFQPPLLYQVATAGLSTTDIAHPVRSILRKQENFNFHLGEVTHIDFKTRYVEISTERLNYDYLIIAVGSQTNYFGLDSVAQHGFDLIDLDDAIAVRNHILCKFELATQEDDPKKRQGC